MNALARLLGKAYGFWSIAPLALKVVLGMIIVPPVLLVLWTATDSIPIALFVALFFLFVGWLVSLAIPHMQDE